VLTEHRITASDEFPFADEYGPARVVHLHEPATGLRAVVVVDNVGAGPAIGGVRMAPDVSTEECFRLARAMTLKNAAAELPHGGGKAVIFGDPTVPAAAKEQLIRAFASLIAELDDYIPGPDMGTDETCMAWIHDETGRAVGLPRELGGIPLDTIGATGFGVVAAIDVARDYCGLTLDGARVAVQGFGAVGMHAARLLRDRGAVLVAACDSAGTLVDERGLDVDALRALKQTGAKLVDAPFGTKLERDAIIGVDCEILVPAARPDALTGANVDLVRARLVAQGANIPVTPEAEARLHERGILSLPDFVANAGGVICAAVEYHGGSEAQAFATIEERVGRNMRAVLDRATTRGVAPREAARQIVDDRIRAITRYRRWH
jgi:glutamate dehydrogenase/leucine dehydrogenase